MPLHVLEKTLTQIRSLVSSNPAGTQKLATPPGKTFSLLTTQRLKDAGSNKI
jgi:hypothetical protein